MGNWDRELLLRELDEFATNYEKYTEPQQFELFTAWSILRAYELESYDLEAGRVGDGGDGGIDWLYFVVNGRVVSEFSDEDIDKIPKNSEIEVLIGQAKKEDGFKAVVGEKFTSTFSDLFMEGSEPSIRTYNKELVARIDDFKRFYFDLARKKPSMCFRLFSCTTATQAPHKDVTEAMDIARSVLQQAFKNARVVVELLGATEIFALLNEIPSYDTDLKYEAELESKTGKVALVGLQDYYHFLKGESGEIHGHYFEANVRDFEGSVKVNKQITEGLAHPELCKDFWWMNNGITMLVSEPPVSREKTYSLQDVQIVNGLQTSYAIFNYFNENPAALRQEDRQVLVRILLPTDESEKSQIIRATNSQTAVQPASLRATDPIHREIENILKLDGLFYERRKNYYKNKNHSPKLIVSITLLSQAIMSALLLRPDTARARPSSFLNKDETYEQVFGNRELGDFRWCAKNQKRVEEILSKVGDLTPGERNNYRFYVLMMLRVFGHFRSMGDASWRVSGCRNDWDPADEQVQEITAWVRSVAQDELSENAENLDTLCKGPGFVGMLRDRWLADPDVAKAWLALANDE